MDYSAEKLNFLIEDDFVGGYIFLNNFAYLGPPLEHFMFRGYVSTRRRNMAFSCASGQ
jgi:hypothetical protein